MRLCNSRPCHSTGQGSVTLPSCCQGVKGRIFPHVLHFTRWIPCVYTLARKPDQPRGKGLQWTRSYDDIRCLWNKCFIIYSTNAAKTCNMSQYFTGRQIKSGSIAASTCFPVTVQRNLQYVIKVTSHDKMNLWCDNYFCLTWCFNLSPDIV